MNEVKLPQDLICLLEKAFSEEISNFEVVFHDNGAERGGYFGEITFISLRQKKTNEQFHLVVKNGISATLSTTADLVENIYSNEINFYANIWTTLDNFQKSFPVIKPLEIIPHYYGSSKVKGSERIILENLKCSGFVLYPRDQAFEDNHMRLLLRSYGRFHGISAAFRELYPEKFGLLTDELNNSTDLMMSSTIFKSYFFPFMQETYSFIENEEIRKKLKRYTERGPQIAIELTKYIGKNPVINHGDPWSNNMMFKYNSEGIPIDMRLLDFQICRTSSVVNDISYLFYCGASKEIIEKFEYYLNFYYNEFADTLRSFKLDPSKIFTFEDLKSEWKDHCIFGFMMCQLLWRNKLCKFYEERSMVELDAQLSSDENSSIDFRKYEFDTPRLKEIYIYLVEHLCRNNYL